MQLQLRENKEEPVMRIETENSTPSAMNIAPIPIMREYGPAPTPHRPKFAISMEKKIEHLWLDSKDRGWNFSEFAAVVMEILTVLHHRNKLRRADRARSAAPVKKLAVG
jgi:hypothetical protein